LPAIFTGQRRRGGLFRNGRGSQADFPGNKETCKSNAIDSKRLKGGTITLKFGGSGTPGAADCPIFTKIVVLN
jgi:hypothetical protein